jgi:hypothetical protein
MLITLRFSGHGKGDRAAQTSSRACYDCHFVYEFHGAVPPFGYLQQISSVLTVNVAFIACLLLYQKKLMHDT